MRMPVLDKIEILGVGSVGVIQDRPGHTLPSAAWTSVNNVRFDEDNAKRIEGYTQALLTPAEAPRAIFNVPGSDDQTFWITFSATKAWVQNVGVETEITRLAGVYTSTTGPEWQMTPLADIPIFTNNVDVPQYWPTLTVATKLANLPNWDANKRAKVLRAFGGYVFALNMTESGASKPHRVLVSHKADPGTVPASWDPTDATKDATQFELTDVQGGEILDGLPLVDQFIIYKKNSTHVVRFQGGTELWKRDVLYITSGVLYTRCVCAFDNGTKHFVVTQTDIVIHAGGNPESIVEAKNKNTIFAEIDPATYKNSFCIEDKLNKEVLFCYPTAGNTYANKAFVYDYVNKTSTFRDLPAAGAAFGVIEPTSPLDWASATFSWDSTLLAWSGQTRQGILFADFNAGKVQALNQGLDFGGSTPIAFLERTQLVYKGKYIQFGQRVQIARVWVKATGTSKWTVSVGMQEYRDDPVTWSTPVLFDPANMRPYVDIDPPAQGRIPSIRFEQQENTATTLEGYDLRLALLGEFGGAEMP